MLLGSGQGSEQLGQHLHQIGLGDLDLTHADGDVARPVVLDLQ
jgi:hypothetical protein